MKPVVYSEYARREIRAVVKYYEHCQRGLGREFNDELKHAVLSLRRFPQAFDYDKATDTRRYVMKRFPYFVHYLEGQDQITIVAIAHQRRRPGHWLDHGNTTE